MMKTTKLCCWICALFGMMMLSFAQENLQFEEIEYQSEESEQLSRNPASTRRGIAQDRSEGWVVRQTENGLVKVPARQYFRFEGLSLSGKAYTPFQAVFDQRPARRSKSLIPVRNSFKREVLDASGYSGR